MSDSDLLAVPQVYVRVIRWAECVFIVPALAMLMFLPIPPRGAEVVSFVTLSAAILAAGFVWWGLRSPTRLALLVAIILAGAWSLLWLRNAGIVIGSIIGIFHGSDLAHGVGPAVVLSYLVAFLTAVPQLVVLFAWLKGTRTGTNTSS
jgi:hypothetical protein